MPDSAKDQYQVPEGVRQWTIRRHDAGELGVRPMKTELGGPNVRAPIDVIAICDLPAIKQQWEAEQREEVERLKKALAGKDATLRTLRDWFRGEAQSWTGASKETLYRLGDECDRALTAPYDRIAKALAEQRERLLGDEAKQAAIDALSYRLGHTLNEAAVAVVLETALDRAAQEVNLNGGE